MIGAVLMDKSGRRPLLLVSATGTFLGCFLTGTGFLLEGQKLLLEWVSVLAVRGVLTYIASFSIGMGAVHWVIMSEEILCSSKVSGIISVQNLFLFFKKFIISVLGLPMGNEEIKYDAGQKILYDWMEKFPEATGLVITPKMARDRIIGSRIADTKFKWNFPVMVYNFFMEANQNRSVTRNQKRDCVLDGIAQVDRSKKVAASVDGGP